MIKAYGGYQKCKSREGDRVAFLVNMDEPNKVLKTYFVFDPEYEADDDDDDAVVPPEGADQEPEQSLVVSEAVWSAMKLSEFNRELFMRALDTRSSELFRMAEPHSQQRTLLWGYNRVLSDVDKDATKKDDAKSTRDMTLQLFGSLSEQGEPRGQEVTVPQDSRQILITASAIPTFRTAVPGPTGVGKSVWVAKRCETYRMEYPWSERLERKKSRKGDNTDEDCEHDSDMRDDGPVNHRINIFSFFDHDPAYDGIEGLFYIPLNKDLLDGGGLEQDAFRHSLCVFDDVDALTGPLREMVLEFRDQCLKTGRKKDISCISVIHEMFGGISTRPTWKESEELVVFPRADTAQIVNLLVRKYGMPKNEIGFILSQKTRSVLIKRTHPRVVITRKMLKVLS